MKKVMKVYVLMAEEVRNGGINQAYPVGVYDSQEEAEKIGLEGEKAGGFDFSFVEEFDLEIKQ